MINKDNDISHYLQMKEEIGSISCHINNGGVNFIVGHNEEGQPIIRIFAKHFGHITSVIELGVTRERILALADLFNKAKDHPFKGDNSFAAQDPYS